MKLIFRWKTKICRQTRIEAIHLRWIRRSELPYIYDVNECRGDFRIVAGAGDECLEVLRGVFGFDGALEDVEPTGERHVLAGERAILVGGDDFFTGERVRFEDAQLTLALPFKRN